MNNCTNGSCTPNRSIKCTVSNCAYPTKSQCVDCESFKLKG